MKITGYTKYGYLVEMTETELSKITGNPDDAVHSSNTGYSRNPQVSHEIGTAFNVSETWGHLQRLLKNGNERKSIAESLRAAATLIEHTPSPIVELVTNETPAE